MHQLIRSLIIGLLAFTSAVVMSISTTAAQSYALIRIDPKNDGSEQFEKVMEELKASSNFYLGQLAGDYAKHCELSDKQLEKLRLAAKGATLKFVASERKKHVATLERYQQMAGADPEAQQPATKNLAFYLQTQDASSVIKQDLWTSVLKTVVSEKQRDEYEQAIAKREKFIRKAAVDSFLAKVELGLFLSEKQRDEMRPLIDETLGDFLAKYLKLENQMRITRSFGPPKNIKNSPYVEKFKDVLTAEQLEQWKRKYEPLLDSLKLDIQRAEQRR